LDKARTARNSNTALNIPTVPMNRDRIVLIITHITTGNEVGVTSFTFISFAMFYEGSCCFSNFTQLKVL
jgi:hypothetical protein